MSRLTAWAGALAGSLISLQCSFPEYAFTTASANGGGGGTSFVDGGAGRAGSAGSPSEAGAAGAVDSCADDRRDGTETDIDCGGRCDVKCDVGAACQRASDCASGVCADQSCSAPSCTDHVQNGQETDVDCGGRACSQCPALATCDSDASCESGVCRDGHCDAGLVLRYVAQALGASEARAIPEIHLINLGKGPVPLASLSLRYYFTVAGEDASPAQVTQCTANVAGATGGDITAVTTWALTAVAPVFEADTYLNVSFQAATTSLAPGDAVTIYSTLSYTDGGPMIQSNDYSFDASATADQPFARIPVYLDGALVYGVPPG